MNEHEARRIAAAANHLRPDWPEAQVMTLITDKLMDRPRRDVAVALVWVACDVDTTTPYRVLESGPWWKAVGGFVDGGSAPRPLKPHEACQSCGRALHRPDDVCAGRPQPATHAPHIETVRHLVDVTRRNLCSHGVDPALCIDHRPAKGATTPQPEESA